MELLFASLKLFKIFLQILSLKKLAHFGFILVFPWHLNSIYVIRFCFLIIISNHSESLHANFVYTDNSLKSVLLWIMMHLTGVSQQVCQKWQILCRNHQLCKMGLMVGLWINSCIRRWLKSSVNVMLSFIAERFTTATLAWQFPLFQNKVIHQLVSSSIKAKILRTKLPRMMNSCNLWTNPRPGGRLQKRDCSAEIFRLLL